MKKKRIKKDGWAITKRKPHKNHPAYYRKKGSNDNDIEYVTFTHSKKVDFNGNEVVTIRLNKNINKKENDTKYSHVVPIVYDGKRDSLGKKTNDFYLSKDDYDLVMDIFKNASKKNKKPR